jgi:arabinose-5-phosphate isomerase
LTGIFTDSDLAKMLEQHRESELDRPISEVMTVRFSAIQQGARLDDAIAIMAHRKISELPVVDSTDHPLGMIDITDVLEIEQSQSPKPLVSVATSSVENASCDDPNSDPCNPWDHGPTSLRIFGPLT